MSIKKRKGNIIYSNPKFISMCMIGLIFGFNFTLSGIYAASSGSSIAPSVSSATKTIDGNLTFSEWNDTQNITEFYLDVDNAGDPANVDGMNYFYLDEDSENLYFGFDLCSDQTNDYGGEWVGLWLNTNGSILNESDSEMRNHEWSSLVDQGFESLIYDVDNNQEVPYFVSETENNRYYKLNTDDQLDFVSGYFSGDYSGLESSPEPDLEIIGENILGVYTSELRVNLSLHDVFNVFSDIHIQNLLNLSVRVYYDLNTSLTSHTMNVWQNHLPSLQQTNIIDLEVTPVNNHYEEYTIGLGNLTGDDYLQLGLNALSSNPFSLNYTMIDFHVVFPQYSSLDAFSSELSYSSIKNYALNWSFGESMNNATDHRMFEISVPKSELEGFYSATDLGIIIGGYGTMSFEGSNYWCYQTNYLESYMDQIMFTNSSAYFEYSLSGKGYLPQSFTLTSNFTSPPSHRNFTLTWTESTYADIYSVYVSENPISELDPSVTLLNSTTATFLEIQDLANGTYHYIVKANNTFGEILSNSIMITMDLDENMDGGDTPINTDGFTPGQIAMIIILILGVAGVGIFLFFKIRKQKETS